MIINEECEEREDSQVCERSKKEKVTGKNAKNGKLKQIKIEKKKLKCHNLQIEFDLEKRR
jgi:hypothetical protein